MNILLASSNAGKVGEFAELLPRVSMIPWPAQAPEIPEDGAFFQDNALQKATFARDWWLAHSMARVDGVLADDSGLCVDALWGGPGVLSARFAKGMPWSEKNLRLLSMIPQDAPRTARFVCVLVWLPFPHGRYRIVSGTVEGEMALESRGDAGFGFDPVFVPDGYDRTFGELSPEEKHVLSHRGRACAALRNHLGLSSRVG